VSSSPSLRVHCEHETQCAGCPLIELPYEAQLARKRTRVVDALAAYPSLADAFVQPALAASGIERYRSRAKLVVAPAPGEGVVIGLFAAGADHVVVDGPRCRVQSPALAEVIEATRELARQPGSPLALRVEVAGKPVASMLRAIDVREALDANGAASVLVTWIASRDDVRTPELMESFRAQARALRARAPRVVGVALGLREPDSPQVLASELHVLDGASIAEDRIGPVAHLATYGAFVQAHRGQARRVHELVAAGLAPRAGERVLDLYGGSGAIGLSLAAAGHDVLLVESFAPAAKLAADAAKLLPPGSGAFEAIAGEVSEVLAKSAREPGERSPLLVVNPPRRGIAPLVREQIAQIAPRAIAYVSCDPETLARDLDHLSRAGYAPVSLHPLDMIPLTEEVETVAILEPRTPPVPRIAYQDDEVVIVEKMPHEPTTPQGEYRGSLLARVKRLPGCEQAVPVHRLDVGTSGLVIFARRASFVSAWAEALGAGTSRKIYLAACRGRTPAKGAITRDLRDEGRLVPARTRFRWLGALGGHSILRVVPEQGRTHQIRRHLAAIGHPILGDERYGHPPTNRFFEEKHGLDRTFLHCIRLELSHPRSGVRLVVETPVPGDLRLAISRCGGATALRHLENKAALGAPTPSTLPPPPPGAPSSGSFPAASPVTNSDRPSQTGIRASSPPFEPPTSVRIALEPPDVDPRPHSLRPPITGDGEDQD
jgi:23S rRNA (uracil1939-C5)-methyltransferase